MNIRELREQKLILLECISGSRAYGLDTADSDTDIKGVFIVPKDQFYSLDYPEQISNESNDIVFYELRRFMELLSKNNPNILELLATPSDCIIHQDPLLAGLDPHDFLSRLCEEAFGGYAMTQIKKATGLNKKIMNPMDTERKTVIDFCYVAKEQASVPLRQYLEEKGWRQENCGLSKIPHMHEVYALFHDSGKSKSYHGIMQKDISNDVSLSSIPKGEKAAAIISFNKSGYSKYCKDYREYREWESKRNPRRYQNTVEHGKNYDSKNMMHTIRLLLMAEEIGREGMIKVRRPEREYLLRIKNAEFSYEEILEQAKEKAALLPGIYAKGPLPSTPDLKKINEMLAGIREAFYSR